MTVMDQGDPADGTMHCCLGVLTELYLNEIEETWSFCEGMDPNRASLPGEVQDWAGCSSDPRINVCLDEHLENLDVPDGFTPEDTQPLSALNDGQWLNADSKQVGGLTFDQIADLIEEQL